MIRKNDVVQFTEHHKWRGCLGIVSVVKELPGGKTMYMIGIPMPSNDGKTSTAYIFDDGTNIECIGVTVMIENKKD